MAHDILNSSWISKYLGHLVVLTKKHIKTDGKVLIGEKKQTYNREIQFHIPRWRVSVIHSASVHPLIHDRDPELPASKTQT